VIRIRIFTDSKEAIRRGYASLEDAVVEVHDSDLAALSAEDREFLAANLFNCRDKSIADYNLCSYQEPAPEPTLAGALERLRGKSQGA
jgi:hypothetical protein